jgi:hypothetical protein
MKKLYILLFALVPNHSLMAQGCLPDGIIFSTQAQIDSFQINYPGCSVIDGSITIYGNNITNLSGLNVLTSIGGNLQIENNCGLTNLTGLEYLTFIGGDLKLSNTCLTSLSGLNNLITLGQDLFCYSAWLLTSLNGLGNLNTIGRNLFISCSSISNFTGVDNLTHIGGDLTIGNFYWGGNTSLTSLTGLESLTSISGSLTISSNDSLTDLAGLVNLSSIGNSLYIGWNHTLTNLTGFENLTSINGGLLISNNNSLTDLAGLVNLPSIGTSLLIEGNHNLIILKGLEGLNSIGGDLTIYNNDTLNDISGLANINASTITNLYIDHNDFLSTCHIKSICDFLAAPYGIIVIEENAEGCMTQDQVEAACETVGVAGEFCNDEFSVIPNPILANAVVSFKLEKRSDVKIDILNQLGEIVMNILDAEYDSGFYRVNMNAVNLLSGLYYCRLQKGFDERIVKIVVF